MSGRVFVRSDMLSYRLLVLGSILLLAACSQAPVIQNQAQSCKLTIPVIDARNQRVTLDLAYLCASMNGREEWVVYTNTTFYELSAIRICARALNQSGTPLGPSYCRSTTLLRPGQKLVTPRFPATGAYGITAVAREESVQPTQK